MTLLLSASQIRECLDVEVALTSQRYGLATQVETAASERVVAPVTDGVATAQLPGRLPGIDAYTVKVNAKFPHARPPLRGVVCLHSASDGALLALLDSATVTAWRTGLAAAVATHAFMPSDVAEVGVIGAGAQTRTTLMGLQALRSVTSVIVCDPDPCAVGRLREALDPSVDVRPAGSAEEAADNGILIVATWSRAPVVAASGIGRRCQHITALGFDEPGKRELDDETLESGLVIVDDEQLARAVGVLTRSLAGVKVVSAALAQRSRLHEVRTIYTPVGQPWQDLALSWPVYLQAKARGIGTDVNFHQ